MTSTRPRVRTWSASSAGGDNDTNGHIVGGIVALAGGSGSIPAAWLAAREPIPSVDPGDRAN